MAKKEKAKKVVKKETVAPLTNPVPTCDASNTNDPHYGEIGYYKPGTCDWVAGD